MRINIIGSHPMVSSSKALALRAGLHVTPILPSYTVILRRTESYAIVIDAVACPLETQVLNAIAELSDRNILLVRAGGIRDDNRIEISVPMDGLVEAAVEEGIVRGLLRLIPKKSWWKF